MKITASKRDEILRQKEEYEADRAEKQARYDAQEQRYDDAKREVLDAVQVEVEDAIAPIGLPNLTVRADIAWGHSDDRGIRVQVSDEARIHDENKSLSWTYSVQLGSNGEVKKESSSWSGLQAVTAVQMDHLRKVVQVLELLNNMDWATLLDKALPNYSEYITENNPRWDRQNAPDFDRMLLEADLEEVEGTPVLVSGEKDYRGRPSKWYMILRQTPKRYECAEIPSYAVADTQGDDPKYTLKQVVEQYSKYPVQIAKDKFYTLIQKPIETLEVK